MPSSSTVSSARCRGRSTSTPRARIAIDIVGDAPAWVRRSTFAAQKAKDAIVDRFRERDGARPSVDFDDPGPARERAIRSRPRCGRDRPRRPRRCTSVATANRPSRRRSRKTSPPRCCCVAAGPRSRPRGGAFVDPMCGSGTIVIEAALIAATHRARVAATPLRIRALAAARPRGLGAPARRGARRANDGRAGAGPVARLRP